MLGKRTEPSLPTTPLIPRRAVFGSLCIQVEPIQSPGWPSERELSSLCQALSPTNSSLEKEDKKKWKDIKIMKKLERQRAQEEQAKRQEEEEEAAAQRSNQGKQLGREVN